MIEEVVDQLYDNAKGVSLGHMVWCPVPHLEEVPRILEVERESSERHYASKFEIVQLSAEHFKAKSKLPIKALALHNTEELLISKAKKRPCVVICCSNTHFDDAVAVQETKGRKHLQDNSVILAPLYGTASPDDDRGFPPIMVARIRVFLYNQFFYFPKSCLKSKLGIDKVGVARLDRIFSASPSRGVTPMNLKLSAEPLALLLAVVQERFGGSSNKHLETVRELLAESLPEKCRPGGKP
jgi:hypothetical protein